MIDVARRLYTQEMLDWLRHRVDGVITHEELRNEFNERFSMSITKNQFKACMKNHKITTGTKGTGGPATLFTEEMQEWLRNRVDGKTGRAQLHAELNEAFDSDLTLKQFIAGMKNHGIRCGVDARWKKGQVSHNKGKPMPEHVRKAAQATMFKQGQVPWDTDPVGTEKDVGGYIWVKTNNVPRPKDKKVNWTPKHWLIWSEAYGDIPEDMVIVFKNGNRRDFRLKNLELMTKAESVFYRHLAGQREFRSDNDEINGAYVALAKLEGSIHEKEKHD